VTELVITVYGIPAAQGSKRFVGHAANGRGVMVESSKKVKPWREDVRAACLAGTPRLGRTGGGAPLLGPLNVEIAFTLPKPASAPKRRVTWPDRRPDLDKLLRSTFDAIGSSGLWHDDAQIVEVTSRKVYPDEGIDALDRPGAIIRITTLAGAA